MHYRTTLICTKIIINAVIRKNIYRKCFIKPTVYMLNSLSKLKYEYI